MKTLSLASNTAGIVLLMLCGHGLYGLENENFVPVNVAHKKPVKMLSLDGVKELRPSATNVVGNGVDGNPATFAQAGGQWPWMFELDVGEVHAIGRIVVSFDPARYPTEYQVLVSENGNEWRQVASANNGTGKNIELSNVGNLRHVRVIALKPDGEGQQGFQMSIGELEVYDAAQPALRSSDLRKAGGTQNLAQGKPVTMLTIDGTAELTPSENHEAAGGVDGNHGTRAQAGGKWPWIFQTDLGVQHRVDRLTVAFGPERYPTECRILGSENGTVWRQVTYINDGIGKDIDVSNAGNMRFIRVYGLKPDGEGQPGFQMAISELGVYGVVVGSK